MNPNADSADARLDALLRATRQARPDLARVEMAFETRLLARCRAERRNGLAALAWRVCPFFAIAAIALLGWSALSSEPSGLWAVNAMQVLEGDLTPLVPWQGSPFQP